MKPAACKSRLVLSLLLAFAFAAVADEGIWLPNAFPKDLVQEKYGFEVTSGFLEQLQLSSVRVAASGSFVSPDGLIFTNHHVASECIQNLSTPERDYMSEGFYAAARKDEKTCPGMEANVLLSIDDVTGAVNAGIPPKTDSAEANRMRLAAIARIEKDCVAETGGRCDVVTLYSGERYHLYRYKKYTDVRLVFAPEVDIAAFGGDPDNFTYPRFCLDVAFLRAYENGSPARSPRYLRWSREGVKEGELTFVPGHPHTTGRLHTVVQLEFFRDHSYPVVLRRLESLIRTLETYSAQSDEHKRAAHDNLFSQQNSFKAFSGFLQGLRDPGLMRRKREEEKQLRHAVQGDPKMRREFGGAWEEMAAAYRKYRDFYTPYWLQETAAAHGSELFRLARGVVRLAQERTKPDEKRLREYRDAALPRVEAALFAETPISESMEIAVIADYLEFLRKELGPSDSVVKAALGGKSPREAAEGYVTSSRMQDVEQRRRLAASLEAVQESDDGMIRLARLLDPRARELRKRQEDQVEAVVTASASGIARARFQVYGERAYPDGTFTLRFSFGPVRGYEDNARRRIPYATTFEGLYRRATGEEPYRLPQRWLEAKARLDLSTPFNFVTTADTHGGNSGSPTVNTKGEIIGILFDGNMEALPNRFVYTEEQARSVHVASQGIVETLRKVYRAEKLLEELGL